MEKKSNKDKKLIWDTPKINEMKLSDSEGGGTKKFTSTETPMGQYQPQVNPS